MNIHLAGPNGPLLPPVCLGTMTFGEQTPETEAHAQLDLALERGVNFIDTAELYPVPPREATYSVTESIVGRWLKRQDRSRILLASKAAGAGRGLNWIRHGDLRFNRQQLRAALEGSLRRLQTDYLDLYQLHWPERNQPMFGQWQFDPTQERPATPIREQLEALAELVAEGKVRAIGLSNEHPWGVMQFLRCADELGLPRIVTVQNAFNLLKRDAESSLAEICFREQIGLLAYSPLAFGHLTGKYLANPQAEGRLNRFPGFGQRYEKPGVPGATAAYCQLAREHGLTPVQLALGFVRSRWFVASTILGASTLAQLRENLNAIETPLDDQLLAAIDRLFLLHGSAAP